jgi:hypothetical protein
MPRKSAKDLAEQAANAPRREEKLAALITLEAQEPEGTLEDPETVMAVAENVDSTELAHELDELAPAQKI